MPRRSQRLVASLGLLAIWLTMLMPVASQLFAREGPAVEVVCSTDDHGAPEKAAHDCLDACGYCGLLAHCPALHGVSQSNAFIAAAPGNEIAPSDRPSRRQIRYLRRPSRAPPAFG